MAAREKQHMHMRDAVMLAAPHTWPASIMPVLLAVTFAAAVQSSVSVTLALVLLVIAVLMQSAVNALNDYFDYVKGSDTESDHVERSDAALVYGSFDPKEALYLAIGLLAAAFALGVYCIICAGWIPLAIAGGGAAVVALYSAGRTPLSYLPVGEAVSGLVMGGVLPFASFYVLTRQLDLLVIAWCIPPVIGIALIMMTNNASDIEKDIPAGRRTLPVLLGRARTRALYRALAIAWIAATIVIVGIWFTAGLVVMPFMVLASYPFLRNLLRSPLDAQARIASMGAICTCNVVLGAFYAAAVLAVRVPLVW